MKYLFYALRRITKPAHKIRGLGLGRASEMVRKWAAKSAPTAPLLIEDFRGSARFNCYLREHMGGQIFFRGVYSKDEISFLESVLSDESVFLDIGANHGEFSVAAARLATNGKVIAFEPVHEYRQRLTANLELNGFTNCHVLPYALGETDCNLPIYDREGSYGDGTRNEGLTSLFSSDMRPSLREMVSVRRLDDVLEDMGITHVDLIKLDIEGAEWSALRGAMRTLRSCRPTLILEVGRETCRSAGHEPEDLVEWLLEMNYRLDVIHENGELKPLNKEALGRFQNIVASPT